MMEYLVPVFHATSIPIDGSSKPEPEKESREAPTEELQSLRASGLPGFGSTPLQSTLHLYEGRHRHGSLTEDGCSIQREPALWLPESVGASQEGGLGGEQEACPEGMEGSGSNGPVQRV